MWLRIAAGAPVGPAYMSPSGRSRDGELVSVIMSRVLPDRSIVAGLALVDRTQRGVMNAFAWHLSTDRFVDLVEQVGAGHKAPLIEVPTLEAQVVVFLAIDHARERGIAPHQDFPAEVFGPRPTNWLPSPTASTSSN